MTDGTIYFQQKKRVLHSEKKRSPDEQQSHQSKKPKQSKLTEHPNQTQTLREIFHLNRRTVGRSEHQRMRTPSHLELVHSGHSGDKADFRLRRLVKISLKFLLDAESNKSLAIFIS